MRQSCWITRQGGHQARSLLPKSLNCQPSSQSHPLQLSIRGLNVIAPHRLLPQSNATSSNISRRPNKTHGLLPLPQPCPQVLKCQVRVQEIISTLHIAESHYSFTTKPQYSQWCRWTLTRNQKRVQEKAVRHYWRRDNRKCEQAYATATWRRAQRTSTVCDQGQCQDRSIKRTNNSLWE